MFGVRGEHDLTEQTLPRLSGWRNSRPVRIGNDAWKQRQLDVYGELLGAVSLLSSKLADIDGSTRLFLNDVVDGDASRWEQMDQGIWEIPGEPCHFYIPNSCVGWHWIALSS